MGALELVASLVNSLGWPISAAVIVALLRKSILGLLQRVGDQLPRATKMSMGAGSWQIALDMAEKIRQEEEDAQPAGRLGSEQADQDSSKARQVLEIDPEAAVMMAFANVELAAREACSRADLIEPGSRRARSMTEIMFMLEQEGQISKSVASGIRLIQHLRNQAAHKTGPVSYVEASMAITLASEVERSLWRIAPTDSDAQ